MTIIEVFPAYEAGSSVRRTSWPAGFVLCAHGLDLRVAFTPTGANEHVGVALTQADLFATDWEVVT